MGDEGAVFFDGRRFPDVDAAHGGRRKPVRRETHRGDAVLIDGDEVGRALPHVVMARLELPTGRSARPTLPVGFGRPTYPENGD